MSSAATTAETPAAPGRTPRRAAPASWIDSALEYYDFAVYGTAAALVLDHLFFPAETSPGVAILFAMGTVGVAYVVRPLGALVMGPLTGQETAKKSLDEIDALHTSSTGVAEPRALDTRDEGAGEQDAAEPAVSGAAR